MRLRDGSRTRAVCAAFLDLRYHIVVLTRQDAFARPCPKPESPIWASPRRIGPAIRGARRAA